MPRLEEGREDALKQTFKQISLARTKTDGTLHHSPKMTSMRRTFGSIGGSNESKTSPKIAAPPQWTEQDVQAALRLVREGWEGQVFRLDRYLERNWKLYHGVPLEDADYEEQKDLRPSTANNLAAIYEKVSLETTPTREKQVQLGHDPVAKKLSKDPLLLPDLGFERGAATSSSSSSAFFPANVLGIEQLGYELPGIASTQTVAGQDADDKLRTPSSPDDDGGRDLEFTVPARRVDSSSGATIRGTGLAISLAEYQSRVLGLDISPEK